MTTTTNTATPDYIVDGTLTDGEAWVPLQTTVLSSDAAEVVFQSSTGANDWSQYMDLVLIGYMRGAAAQAWEWMKGDINDVTGVYEYQSLDGDGSNIGSNTQSTQTNLFFGYAPCASAAANVYGIFVAQFYDINSGKSKNWTTMNADDMNGSGYVWINAGTSIKTEPISKISVHVGASGAMDTLAGSRYDLFGILPRMVS